MSEKRMDREALERKKGEEKEEERKKKKKKFNFIFNDKILFSFGGDMMMTCAMMTCVCLSQ